MTSSTAKALDIATEITAARIANSNVALNENGGSYVAKFFEAIFNKVIELEKEADQ